GLRDDPAEPTATVSDRPAEDQSVQGPRPSGRPPDDHRRRVDAAGGTDPKVAGPGLDRARGTGPDRRRPLVRVAQTKHLERGPEARSGTDDVAARELQRSRLSFPDAGRFQREANNDLELRS